MCNMPYRKNSGYKSKTVLKSTGIYFFVKCCNADHNISKSVNEPRVSSRSNAMTRPFDLIRRL